MSQDEMTTGTGLGQLLGPSTMTMILLVAPPSTAYTSSLAGEMITGTTPTCLPSSQSTSTWGIVRLNGRQ